MKKCIAILLLLLHGVSVLACSTFLLSRNGQHVFGRNYDWVSGNGMLMVNARGARKAAFNQPGEPGIEWTSACGSVTFNQFGKEFPHGGMNEKGLVVELMWLAGSTYPEADQRAAMNELQWIQFQLDNCATVAEVIATDTLVRISRNNAAPLHYLVADATGAAATIEFVDGKMKVHQGRELPYPVLTNTVYEEAVRGLKNGDRSDNSVERFTTACRQVQRFQQSGAATPAVPFAFTILNDIAQGDYTKWQIVYDISNRQVYFETSGNKGRKALDFSSVDFSCAGTSLALDLQEARTGDVARQLSRLSPAQNKALIERSAFESRSQLRIDPLSIEGAAAFFERVRCLP
ncbi:MAG TPA: linear amide C-N hydrolase [Chitinophagaceae bacterium]|nr:linear amide C-N hydrolase [Chitinophagaceae bacterium]